MKNNKKSKRIRKNSKSKKTQQLWKQKGCSKNVSNKRKTRRMGMKGGSCGCGMPFGGTMNGGMKGGTCGCGMIHKGMKGGSPALYGPPWTPAISGWPGVAGQDGITNYFSLNKHSPYDPQTQGVMSERAGPLFLGKYTGGKKSKKQKGGFIGQDLLNLGRNISYGLGSAYNSLYGYPQPVNPMPFKDQLVKQ